MPDKSSNPPEKPSAKGGAGSGDSSSKQMPEGMRVVRKRRKEREGSRQTLFLKKRDILREMHEDVGAVGVKEQVERLRTARKAQQEEGKPMEEDWGGAGGGHRGARWFILRIFAIVIPVLAIVTAFVLTKGDGKDKAIAYDPKLDLGKNEPEEVRLPYDPTGPVAWFNNHPHEAYESSVRVLDKLNAIPRGAAPEDLLRNEEIAVARIGERGIGWSSKFFTADARKLFWSTDEVGKTGFILLEGRRENFTKFRSYFVKTPAGLRLDWEATTGWCEIPLETLPEASPVAPVLVRCHMRKEPHYDVMAGPGSRVSWYLLRDAEEGNPVWGFVPVGGALDRELLDLFHFGWMIYEREEYVRATLRVVKPERGNRANEFEIVELVTREWVLP